jgi:hypothetical protein
MPPGSSQGNQNDIGFEAVGPIKNESKNTPYEQTWTLGFEKELPGKIIIESNYIGKKGTHLYMGGFREHNHLSASLIEPLIASGNVSEIGFLNGDGDTNGNNTTVTNPFCPNQVCNPNLNPNSQLAQSTLVPYQLYLPYLLFTSFQGDSPPIASSIYHSVQFRAEKSFSNGLQFLATYTFSKSIDNSSTPDDSMSWLGGGLNGNTLSVQDPNNLKAERAVSTWDIPQVFQFSYVYALPFGRGRTFGNDMNKVFDAIVGGWQTNGIIRLDDGRPLIPYMAGGNATIPTYSQRPNITGKLKRSSYSLESTIQVPNAPPPNSYFANPGALTAPPEYTLGNVGRTITSVRTPGQRNVDLSMFKEFPLNSVREGMRLEFRIEAFNAFNHPYFDAPDVGVGTPGNYSGVYGQITGTVTSMRQTQLAMKLYW